MKRKFLLFVFMFPALLFVDYLVLAFVGFASKICGANNDFYCGPYCFIALSILVFSSLGVFYFLSQKKSQV